jgi:hypothetical protein
MVRAFSGSDSIAKDMICPSFMKAPFMLPMVSVASSATCMW